MAEDVFGIVGSVVAGAYRVDAVVAEGGFGVVYRAFHSGFRAPVALKCLKIPEQFGPAHQEQFLEQFRAEAELLFRLSASLPTVVRPLHIDAMTTPAGRFVPFMALEWLEGLTLDRIAEQRKKDGLSPLSVKKLARMLTPIARALERAHNFPGPDGPVSIVHRDVKPENIFIAELAGEQVVKILDFGIGKAKSVASQVAGRASQQSSGVTSFTPAYGAPEQWLPKRYGQTGPWTDVWGLALTLVEVAAARPIIDGDQAAMMGTVLDPARRPTPRSEGIEVSDAVEAVFQKALAVDPRDRYSDAGTFWTDLLRALGVSEPTTGPRAAATDPRSDGGMVPRVESVAPRFEAPAARAAGPPTPREAPTVAADGKPASIPDLEPSRTPSAVSSPAASPAPTQAPPSSRRPAFRELDAPSATVDLSLDLPEGDPIQRRVTPAPFAAVRLETPPPSTRTSRVSGSLPAVRVASRSGETPAAAPEPPSLRAVQAGSRELLGVAPPPAQEATLGERVRPGVILVVLSVVVTAADQIYSGQTGEVLGGGLLRPTVLAGALMVGGIGWIVLRLLPK